MKLAVFDFDSTLMDGETLDIIAKETEYYKEIKEITEKGMKGEIDFFESLISRVALLEGMKLKKVNEICKSLPIMNGAEETIKELKNKYSKMFIGRIKSNAIDINSFKEDIIENFLEKDKIYSKMENSNSSLSATSGVAFYMALEDGSIKNNSKVALCGFGSGYTKALAVFSVS